MLQYVESRRYFNLFLNWFSDVKFCMCSGIPEQGPRVFNCKFLCVCQCFVHKVIIAVPSIVIVISIFL